MVSRDEVIYAYRMLLGREPESEAAIQGHLAATDWLELRDRFVRSEEFQVVMGPRIANRDQYDNLLATPGRVDVEVSAEHFDILLCHIRSAWEALGVERPHWSVITAPIFRPDQIDANLHTFYESGAQSWLALQRAAERAGKLLPNDWTVFELGCGVGRVTAQLARRFHSVVACDVSRPHLDIARAHLSSLAVDNVSLAPLSDLKQLTELKPFDLFYSIIVLQHNPPPLIHRILQIIFQRVNLGGCVYFQVPVARWGYQFVIDNYIDQIRSEDPIMETHILPQNHLFKLLHNYGLRLLDVQRDSWQSPPYISLSLFAEKVFWTGRAGAVCGGSRNLLSPPISASNSRPTIVANRPWPGDLCNCGPRSAVYLIPSQGLATLSKPR